MAENSITIDDARPEDVFAVLLDAWSYADWVVGADHIRAVDDDWPNPGSRFHHTVGVGPAKTDDTTTVLDIDAPRRLVLDAHAGPAGTARVAFLVEPDPDNPTRATRVTIEEDAVEGPAEHLPTPVTDVGFRLRNAETLRRLRKVVEERVAANR
jgi:uncharacterized protein YndB with AHSA1/START domain